MGDLRSLSLAKLRGLFGEKQGLSLSRLCRGIDDRPWDPRPPRKSVGAQIAWGVRFEDLAALRSFVAELTEEALRRLERHGARGSSLTIKVWKARPDAPHCGGVGSGGCDVISRSAQCATDPGSSAAVKNACAETWRLCESTGAAPTQVRGVGIHIGGLEKPQPSLSTLFDKQGSEGPPKSDKKLFAEPPQQTPAPAEKLILHLDVDCFFLAVHEKYDPSLKEAGPLVLWQYNDVICISPEAKDAWTAGDQSVGSKASACCRPQLLQSWTVRKRSFCCETSCPISDWEFGDNLPSVCTTQAAGVKKHMRPSEAQPLVEPRHNIAGIS